MKEVNLIFVSLGYNTFYQAQIYIYDINNNLIYEGTTYNGKIKLCLLNNNGYRLKIITCNQVIITSFYVSNSYDNYYFNTNTNISRNITFILKDYYYNLMISKGELILWQRQ